jgi:nucleotide-binding universal stress UspA family protein
MEISRIVVGTDFSPESEVAARYGIKIARHTGADVVLVHAGMVPDHSLPSPRNEAAREWQRIVDDRLAADRGKLEELRQRLASQAPEVSHMMIDGFADTALCEAGKQLGADLLIVGTHGRTGLTRFLLGSVAERVVRLYERNVMVARPGAQEGAGFHRILVPTDFSMHAEDALRLALVLAAPGATVDVFHTWDTPPELALEWTGPILHELAEQARASGENLLQKYQREELTITYETARARAIAGIIDRLHEHEHDLVVMGSHGRRGLRRFLLGSVAEKIVRHAPCSVIVTHHREQ